MKYTSPGGNESKPGGKRKDVQMGEALHQLVFCGSGIRFIEGGGEFRGDLTEASQKFC